MTTSTPPLEIPRSSLAHWRNWHSVAVILITAFFAWMAIRRPWELYLSWIVVMLALVAFTLIVGRGVTGVWKGALIDDRNKVSLSRLQMLTWTVVVLAAFGVIAVARIQQDAVTALDVAVPSTV